MVINLFPFLVLIIGWSFGSTEGLGIAAILLIIMDFIFGGPHDGAE